MKRDFDLIRRILLDVESIPPAQQMNCPTYDEFNKDVIAPHVVLLHEAGLIDASVLKMLSGRYQVKIRGLTWAGHDFLDAIRDDTLWAKAKKTILAPAGGVAFTVLLEWAKSEVKTRLGLPP